MGKLFELPRIPLALVEEPRTQPVAQLDAALNVAAARQHGAPLPVALHHAHLLQFPLAENFKEEHLAGEDVDGFAAWCNGPLAAGLLAQGAFSHRT